VEANFPLILDVARRVGERRPGTRFVVPLASERLRPLVEGLLEASGLECDVSPPENSDDAMRAAHAAVSVSGTATLHLLAHRTPAVICYRIGAGSRLLSKLLIVSPFIALPNLLAGKEVVPEFLATEGSGEEIAEALLPMLEHGSPRRKARAVIRALTHRLDVPGVPERAARWVLATARRE
jgi:lipid-A-disaccharide synthase